MSVDSYMNIQLGNTEEVLYFLFHTPYVNFLVVVYLTHCILTTTLTLTKRAIIHCARITVLLPFGL